MFENKRGQTEILGERIFEMVIIIFVLLSLLFFINQNASGKLIEKQILAKEICLATISAKSGTTLTIEHNPNLIIEKKGHGINVRDKNSIIASGYFYDCYGHFEISPIGEGKTRIEIN